jgi:hypothetical protein
MRDESGTKVERKRDESGTEAGQTTFLLELNEENQRDRQEEKEVEQPLF